MGRSREDDWTRTKRLVRVETLVNQGGIAGLWKYWHGERNEDSSTR